MLSWEFSEISEQLFFMTPTGGRLWKFFIENVSSLIFKVFRITPAKKGTNFLEISVQYPLQKQTDFNDYGQAPFDHSVKTVATNNG